MVDKKIFRRRFLESRLTLSLKDVKTMSEKIISSLFSLQEFKKAVTVMFYADARNEVQTREAIKLALAMGKRVVLPKVKKDRGLLAVEIKDISDLKPGTFGILEPESDDGLEPEVIDLVVVPGVAFDRQGHRLGYGAGYYDGFLPKLRPGVKKIALAFELQVAESIPVEEHDVKMDTLITEKCVYRFCKSGQVPVCG